MIPRRERARDDAGWQRAGGRKRDYGLTEPVKKPPLGWPPTGPVGNDPDITEELMCRAGGDPNLAAMLTTRPLEEIYAQEQSRGEGNAPT